MTAAACVLASAHAADASQESAAGHFRFESLTIQILDQEGNPVPNAHVAGYSHDFQLAWPRFPDVRTAIHLYDQYYRLWYHEFNRTTDKHGMIAGEVPPGTWDFYAVAITQANDVLLLHKKIENVHESDLITLQPTTTHDATFQFKEKGVTKETSFKHTELFAHYPGAPFAMHLSCDLPQDFRLSTSLHDECTLWTQGIFLPKENDDGTTPSAFIIDWGSTGQNIDKSRHVFWTSNNGRIHIEQDAPSPYGLEWKRKDAPGLYGTLQGRGTDTFLITPGLYSIGYEREIRNTTCSFNGWNYSIQPKGKIRLNFTDELWPTMTALTGTKRVCAQLLIVDTNNHWMNGFDDQSMKESSEHPRFLLAGEAQTPWGRRPLLRRRDGNYDQGRQQFQLQFDAFHSTTDTSLPLDRELITTHQWRFELPMAPYGSWTLTPPAKTSVSSDTLRCSVPSSVAHVTRRHLQQCDLIRKKIQRIVGRGMHNGTHTDLLLHVDMRGANASLSGSFINCATHWLLRTEPEINHDLIHESAHNFDLNHGGLMELVVERAKSPSMQILGCQNSKWLFFDRMNGRTVEEGWYPHTGFYLAMYAHGGMDFLNFMLQHEDTKCTHLENLGFTRDEVVAALASFFTPDIEFIATRYGLVESPERIWQARQLLNLR